MESNIRLKARLGRMKCKLYRQKLRDSVQAVILRKVGELENPGPMIPAGFERENAL